VDGSRQNGSGAGRLARLIRDLTEARSELVSALDAIEPARLAQPGLAGVWSARELVAHLGYWTGNAVEAIHLTEQGRPEEFGPTDDREVDERNETVARVARETSLATVRRREEASFEALVERLRSLDPALLDVVLGDGGSLERAIRGDGPSHYREHAEALRG
jgi:hypothetical protein